MRLQQQKKFITKDDNLLPLVNIIFLLLIFFMIAGVIQKQKELYDVQLASATIDEYVEKEMHTLFIDNDRSLVLNDKAVPSSNLSSELKKLGEEKNLIVAADSKLLTKDLNKILLILSKNKIENITLMMNKND
jgi:biopolymer transport protein ExbD|tara:strand:+ start:1103 stop:1501 length:399 start_codon:yes stop_codon:yes gene_type:complete